MKKYFPLWLIVIFVFAFLLHLPSLFDPYSYGDEGVYLTLGEAARRGLVFYRDIYDNKPPLLYLLAAISGSLFWFRFLLLTSSFISIFFFFKLAKALFPNHETSAKIVTGIFAFLSSIPLLEGNVANAEMFMMLPTIIAVFLLFREEKTRPFVYFFAGILFSLATLFKIPAAFDFLAISVFLLFFRKIGNWKLKIGNLFIFCIGFTLPILLFFLYYWSQNALGQYFTAAFAQNIPYLSSWQGGKSSLGLNFGLPNRGLLLLLTTVFVWFCRQKLGQTLSFVIIWFLFALFAATLSGRPYPHYLVQILVPASLLLMVLFNGKIHLKIIALAVLGLIWGTVVYFHFWSYPNLSYYENFLSFALGQKTKDDYFRGFGDKTLQTYKLAEFLQTHTDLEEKVFLWGDSPIVYALSRRLPVGRYTASYHIIDFKGYEETINLLKNNPPRFIIDLNDENRPFPELAAFITQKYILFRTIDKAEIYLRLPEK